MAEPIKIEGLKEFQRALKKLDSDLPKTLRLAFNEAADIVVKAVKPKVPRRTGRAQKSIRAASTQTAARVRAGGKRAEYYPWLDFGGRVGIKRSVKREFLGEDGRYLYHTYFQKKRSGEFTDILEKAMTNVIRQAGIEVD